MLSRIKRFWNDESGVSATEYGIIAAIIAVGLITILFTFRGSLQNMFGRASTAVNTPP
jgi:pilus assembly protein Flp/PilA